MNYFITGSHGFLGEAIVEHLLCNNHKVIRYNRDCPIVLKNIDVVIHLAAEIYDELVMFDSNVTLTFELLEAARHANIKSFVYVGSSSEYGEKTVPMREDMLLEPRTLYEATKGCGTLLTQAFARRYNMPTAIVRPFSVYGPGEPKHRFIPTLLRAVDSHERVIVHPGTHDFIHIGDFVQGVLAVDYIIREKRAPYGDIINIGSGEEISNFDLVKLVEEVAATPLNYKLVDNKMRSFDTEHWCADITKLKDVYIFEPVVSLKSGLLHTLCYNRGIPEL